MHSNSDAVLTAPAMLFSSITCKYDEDVANVFEVGANKFKLDPETESKDTQVADGAQAELGVTVKSFKEGTHSMRTCRLAKF